MACEKDVASFIERINHQESREALCTSLLLLACMGVCFIQSQRNLWCSGQHLELLTHSGVLGGSFCVREEGRGELFLLAN